MCDTTARDLSELDCLKSMRYGFNSCDMMVGKLIKTGGVRVETTTQEKVRVIQSSTVKTSVKQIVRVKQVREEQGS